jgi:hypothetical protein
MRRYLIDFFKTFDYDADDAAVLLDAYDRIMQNDKTRELWAQALAIYDQSIKCNYPEIRDKADEVAQELYLHEYTTELLIFICMSKKLKAEYDARGIDGEIYHNSMLDLKYKLEECKLVKGIVGSFVAMWFCGFFDLTRFALGRLQFEMTNFGHSYEKNGLTLTPESRVINIHIPRTGTPMDVQSCDESFARAKAFFAEETGEVCAFVCSSWLLYPEHEQMLSHESNVYKFMKRFDVFRSGTSKGRGDLWRLFDTDEKRWDKLPADTSLRRAYVEQLKSGRQVGWGYGVFVL